jgi:hypothetical protein
MIAQILPEFGTAAERLLQIGDAHEKGIDMMVGGKASAIDFYGCWKLVNKLIGVFEGGVYYTMQFFPVTADQPDSAIRTLYNPFHYIADVGELALPEPPVPQPLTDGIPKAGQPVMAE